MKKNMPSKIRKAIGAVKDQTSISLAKVSTTNASNIEVIILKATRHDEAPINERYVKEILRLISSDKVYAMTCAQALARRIGKTRTWIVALKSLVLVLRIFQDGDLYFPAEVMHATKRGVKILNLSSFRDDSSSSPWDYTAFVRTFALYLDERLDCFLTGKLQRGHRTRSAHYELAALLDKLSYWQKLLDRVIATRPTGVAKTNRLVLVSLHAVVKESFDLYRDISDGIALILDSFFHLQYWTYVSAFQVCVKAVKQFEELCAFYDLCKSIGVGRSSEYPSVQRISEEVIATLQEFLKDQSPLTTNGRSPPDLHPSAARGSSDLSSDRFKNCDRSSEPTTERCSDRESEIGSQCNSLEDLMSSMDAETRLLMPMDRYLEQFEKRSDGDEIVSHTDSGSTKSMPLDQGTISSATSTLDLLSLDDWPSEDQKEEEEKRQESSGMWDTTAGETDGWEIVLAKSATASQSMHTSANASPDGFDPSALNNLFEQFDLASSPSAFEPPIANGVPADQAPPLQELHYNPFLEDTADVIPAIAPEGNGQLVPPVNDMFSAPVAPTFNAQNPDGTAIFHNQDDPFAPYPIANQLDGYSNQQNLLQEQQLWLQNQDKIIAKNLS